MRHRADGGLGRERRSQPGARRGGGLANLNIGPFQTVLAMATERITLANLDKFSHRGHHCAKTMATTRPASRKKSRSCSAVRNRGNINSNHEALDKIGVKNTAFGSPDAAHEFLTRRRSLHELAPPLFQN